MTSNTLHPHSSAAMQTVNLSQFHDFETVLNNPHKGWYHHYFDNGIHKYLPECDSDLEAIPGLSQLYLRLAWSFLEPRRGEFNWALIDDVINLWRAKGFTISFRVTCKETSAIYATPKWVEEAGARGQFFSAPGSNTWCPDYGDPIFLEHLDNFHHAFAARYDGQPWVDLIDIGSYGQWGEGHNYLAGEVPAPLEVVRQHIDLHTRHYKKSLLVISDDVVGNRNPVEGAVLADYIHQNGISVRDDSVLVRHYVDSYPETFSLRSPEMFERAASKFPTVLELQHYSMMKDASLDNTWIGGNGSEMGGEMFVNAVRLAQATWVGYHGNAREWFSENPELTCQLANMVGYWFFPQTMTLPVSIRRGESSNFSITWLNNGVARAYRRYELQLRLTNDDDRYVQVLEESDTTRWLPSTPVTETYSVQIPEHLATGEYQVEIRLSDKQAGIERPILLGVHEELRTVDNYHALGQIHVQ